MYTINISQLGLFKIYSKIPCFKNNRISVWWNLNDSTTSLLPNISAYRVLNAVQLKESGIIVCRRDWGGKSSTKSTPIVKLNHAPLPHKPLSLI